ncbi:MAG: DUF4347 domain-containing protein, partial [Pseudomonadales bacterium]
MSKNRHNPISPEYLFEELEPRLLLSADALVTIVGDKLIDNGTAEHLLVDNGSSQKLSDIQTQEIQQETQQSARQELIILDAQTPNSDQLLNDLVNHYDNSDQYEIVILDEQEDGLTQISNLLGNYQDLDAIHIISHGDDGQIQLGNGQIGLDSLLQNEATVSAWGNALSEDADLLIYGCNLTTSAEGQSFINTLAQFTGADITASDDLTGTANLGGDWDLEYALGEIETQTLFDQNQQMTWQGLLALPTAANSTVVTNEDTTYTFSATDFNYSDPDSDPMASIKVTSLENLGELQLSGIDVTVNQVITKADIDAGNLKFIPVTVHNGTGYDSFGFSVNDGTADSASSYTLTVDVTAVNDAPTFNTPSFTGNTITTGALSPWSVTTADVDGDGDLDVLSASFDDDTIAWYENDGSENFTARTITTAANGARSVTTADVDGDGDLDVLSASKYDTTIAWYENDGSENFTVHTITTSVLGAWSMTTADVDGDGDLDVLSASSNDDTIAWYENDGSENFTVRTITTTANGARSVTTADVDGDGD